MGRHRASSHPCADAALVPFSSPTRLLAIEHAGSPLGGSCAVGRVALSVVIGSAAAAVAPGIPAARLPAADPTALNLTLAAPGARATARANQSSVAATAITALAADADNGPRSPDLVALSKATTRGAFVRPVTGTITSNFGPRWGTTHYGLDIANRIGTPIRSVGAGTVIDAGPASGFGLWVRVRLTDGTITVYGHINRALVSKGDRVRAGDLIAEVGNRGQSTGPHLHFETISPDGTKQDPLAWLERHGVADVTS